MKTEVLMAAAFKTAKFQTTLIILSALSHCKQRPKHITKRKVLMAAAFKAFQTTLVVSVHSQ